MSAFVACLAVAVAAGSVAGSPSTDGRDDVVRAAPASAATGTSGGPGRAVPTGASSTTAARVGEKPNVVMIMADDMRVDDLRFAPTIAREIGAGGISFDNSFSPFPLCCPARASFLSGRYAHNHGVMWHEKPYGFAAFDDSRTIATSMSAAGYRTGFVGKYLNGYGAMRSKVTGRASYHYVPAGWNDWYGALDPGAGKGIHGSTYNFFDVPFNANGRVDNSHRGQYSSDVISRFTRQLIKKYAASPQPFFLYASFVAPHHGGPRESDDPKPVRNAKGKLIHFTTTARPNRVKGIFDKVLTRAPGLPANGGPSEADISDKPSMLRRLPEPTAKERKALLEVARQRAEAVYALDQNVAKIIATLKATGQWDRTVLMFTSDNGYFLGEHRRLVGKVLPHEPSLRVPFLVTGPGLRTGERRADPISTVDITATILDLAGAQPPHAPDGASRRTTIELGDQGWTAPVVTEAYRSITGRASAEGFRGDVRSSIGLRTPRFSFTRYKDGEGELYDLLLDPTQMRNVYRDPAYGALRAQLTLLWWQFKNCSGAACQAALPSDLRATAPDNRALVDRYWSGVRAVYGP